MIVRSKGCLGWRGGRTKRKLLGDVLILSSTWVNELQRPGRGGDVIHCSFLEAQFGNMYLVPFSPLFIGLLTVPGPIGDQIHFLNPPDPILAG